MRKRGASGAKIDIVRGERRISAARFKAHCLALMDDLERTGRELIVTKRGRPVAKVTGVSSAEQVPFFGRARSTIRIVGDVVSPVAPDWEPGEDI